MADFFSKKVIINRVNNLTSTDFGVSLQSQFPSTFMNGLLQLSN